MYAGKIQGRHKLDFDVILDACCLFYTLLCFVHAEYNVSVLNAV